MMSRKTLTLTALLAFVALLIPGCGIAGERDEIHRHVLGEFGTAPPSGAAANGNLPTLALESFTAESSIDSRLFVYRHDDTGALINTYDGTHSWANEPQVMLERRAREICARRLGTRVRISGYPAETAPAIRLQVAVLRFDEVRAAGSLEGRAVVVIDYKIRSQTSSGWVLSDSGRIRASKPIAHVEEEMTRGFHADAYSRAMRGAADDVLGQICTALAGPIDQIGK